jgi:DNA-binding beta-propeller fold protein YncE
MRHFATLGVALTLLVLAGAAGADDGDAYLKNCYTTAPAGSCVALTPGFQGADLELSPGARHLYAAVWGFGGGYTGLRLFDVGTRGAFTPRSGVEGCYAPGGAGGECTPLIADGGAYDVDISADGRSVYLPTGGKLTILNRDATSGALTVAQCFGTAPCVLDAGNFESTAGSLDSANVYVRGVGQLAVFDRDATTGALVRKSGAGACFTEELASGGCAPAAPAVGIASSGYETVVSVDGRNLYVSSQAPGGVAVFQRAAGGSLSQEPGTDGGCITVGGTSGSAGGKECVAGPETLAGAKAVTIDRQGAFVLVTGDGGTTLFRRDAANGRLTVTDCLDELGGTAPPTVCHEVRGAAGTDVAVSPDGNHIVVNASGLSGLSFFRLNRATGKLTQLPTRGCVTARAPAAPCVSIPGLLGGPGGVTISPSGLSLFSAMRLPSGDGGSIAGFENDLAPTCKNKTITVRRRTAVAVPLTCTDANSDKVTIEIAAPPVLGSLGVVNQAKRRVLYTPSPISKRRDSFKYRGTARGSAGVPSTVTIKVTARATVDRKAPNTRIISAPPATTSSRIARFRFSSTERGSQFQCKPDWKKGWSSCRSRTTFTQLRPGRHTLLVRAVDKAGNVDRTPAKKVWTIG